MGPQTLLPLLREKVREAFFTFPWEGTALAREFAGRADSFVPVSYAEAWELVRTVARESGESLACP